MTTRQDAYNALTELSTKIATLKCADIINSATRMHEIDRGYGKIETVADVIRKLAAMVYFLRHEAGAVNINDGMYDFAIKNIDRASILVDQIALIEMRAA